MKSFEMAQADKPEEIIAATQRSLVNAMLGVLEDLKADSRINQPGLTWEQIEYFLNGFKEKVPTVIRQDQPV